MPPVPRVAVVPSLLGVLPTITQPDFSMVMAVERPTPPGHSGRFWGIFANREVTRVAGLYWTMVVPVPWTAPDEAILDATDFVPLIRIRKRDGTPLAAGADDPGGRGWVWRQAVVLAASVAGWRMARAVLRRGSRLPGG